jgi:hypothetical protein
MQTQIEPAKRAKEMKLGAALLIAVTCISDVLAQNIPSPDKDPFVGTWKVNNEKSQPKQSGENAKHQTTIARVGDVLVYSSQVGKHKWRNTYLCDGKPHPSDDGKSNKSRPDIATIFTCVYLNEHEMMGETHVDARPGARKDVDSRSTVPSYWRRIVSPDGGEMIVTTYRDKDRTKIEEIAVLDRAN